MFDIEKFIEELEKADVYTTIKGLCPKLSSAENDIDRTAIMSKTIYIICISGIYEFCNSDGEIRKMTWNRTFVKAFDDPKDAVAYVNRFDLRAQVSNSRARDLGLWDDEPLMCCNDVVYARQRNYIQVSAENIYDLRRCLICVFVIESLRE